ncbi:uncharacterized protein [Lepeophtheirus salmonis]|uniref:uncharacterized protein n=1 Tax=Lepeophtheirus salmonis TaxID=72036 RepID=UPI001AE59925|nr:uncharacterized protein LOC121122501 [Lepeophtheirus salmonis]
MFQKQDKMSLKKKSKSMGHLNMESPIFDNHHIIPKKKSYPGEDFKSGVKTTPKKLKGLVRQRTNPMMMPVSVGKAIFSKANKTSSKVNNNPSLAEVFGSKENVLIPNRHRTFLMDTQVKFTVGLQCQERNLFLFNDLLIIAKERSGNQFKLKDQIPLSDVWLANCLSDVSELTTDMLNSFVIGWPITNAIITFSSPNLKNLWWNKLSELIEKERILAPSSTNIQVTYFDQTTNFEHVKSLSVTVRDDARTCIQGALKSLELLANRPLVDINCDYQLWVRTKSDEAPYPLIGHEIPLVIKLYWTRQAFINSRNQKTFDEYRAGCRCSFILRKSGQTYSSNAEDGIASKNKLKKVKSSMKLQRVFRRASKNNEIMDSSGEGNKKFEGKVFGRNLEDVCVNEMLPYAIIVILKRILHDGPETVGIFRRSPNARAMRELREKIDQNEKVDFEECSVFVVAALLKDFLRSLPDCLLQCPKYDEWIRIGTEYENEKDLRPMKNLISNLPRINEITLRHLIYLLKEVADKSKTNMMNASNLGICVGPSVLWCNDSKVMMEQNYSKDVSCLTKTLIEQYESLFGKEIPSLFTCTINGEHPLSIQTENTNGQLNEGNKMTLDNSSLESLLDNEIIHNDEDERMVVSTTSTSGATASGEGYSLNNLSHDSGLTTSDSQLFLFEGGENNSFSSDDFCTISNKKLIYANKSKIHIPVPMSVSEFHHPTNNKKGQIHLQQNKHIHSDTPIKIENNHRKTLVSRVGNVNYIGSAPLKIPLRRTASEESVSFCKSPEQSRKRRPVFHRKGKAPPPPSAIGVSNTNGTGLSINSNVTRSNSVNHNREGKNSSLWYRSCSTTRLNSGNSSACSTLTDEDSTPRVSRSNSYGKHENENFVDGTPMTIEIGNCNTPPGYEETISRQRFLKGFHRSNSCLEGDFASRAIASAVDDDDDDEEEEEVDQDINLESVHQPPPLPPKTERPPLPPKQRQRPGIKLDDTYVNSEELRKSEEGGFVYPQYSSGAVHVSTISENNNRGSGSSNSPTTPKKRSVTRIVATPTRTKSTRNVETQTEEKDFFSLYSSDSDSLEESEEDARNLIDYTPHHRFQSDYYHPIPVSHYVDQRSLSPHRFSNSTNNTPDRRRIEPTNDPLIQGEINWSVSQLRSFFNQGQQKQNSIPVPQYSPVHHSHGSYGNYSIRSTSSGNGPPIIDQRRNNNNIICDVNMYSPKAEQDSDQESYV